jgi:hypothetical protein
LQAVGFGGVRSPFAFTEFRGSLAGLRRIWPAECTAQRLAEALTVDSRNAVAKLSKNGLNTCIAILESPYLEIIDQAIAALKAEIERCGRDFSSFDHQRPFSELVDCGFTEQDASVALDRAEEILGFWH